MNEQVNPYLDRAEDALDDANYLHQDGRELALANRAYYAIFYCICALLASEGIYTKRHSAARAKFSELFVKTGRFDVQTSRLVGNSFAARQSADYDMEPFLDSSEAQRLLEDARQFYALTVAYFQEKSYNQQA